jgi:hypothetical protein
MVVRIVCDSRSASAASKDAGLEADYQRICTCLTEIEEDNDDIRNSILRNVFALACLRTREYFDANTSDTVHQVDVPIFLQMVQDLRDIQLGALRLQRSLTGRFDLVNLWKMVKAATCFLLFVDASFDRQLASHGYTGPGVTPPQLQDPIDRLIAMGSQADQTQPFRVRKCLELARKL